MRSNHGRPLVTMILATLLAIAGLLLPGGGGKVALAAGCVVTATADSGPGSLREQLADPTCSEITFAVTGTIGLIGDLPTLTRTVSVTGPGAASLTIDGHGGNGELYLTGFPLGAGGNLTLRGLTVSGMSRGVYTRDSDTTLSVDSCTFAGNNNALYWWIAAGNMTVANSTFINNVGYGIYTERPTTVMNSTFSGNYGGINSYFNPITVADSTFRDNQHYGLFTSGTTTLANSAFSGNEIGISVGSSGRVAVTNSTISGNVTHGISSQGGSVSVTNSTISGNGQNGMDLYQVVVNLANSTISGNSANGVYLIQSNVTITNSTISGNTADGVFMGSDGNVAIINSTVSGNGGHGLIHAGTQLTLTNTLLAANTAGNCVLYSPVVEGHNLDDGTSCGFGATSLSNATAGLSSQGLADNGGPTKTIALVIGSQAINAGDNSACAAAPVNGVDQRGISRTTGAGPTCDIGAFEVVTAAASITFDEPTLGQTYTGSPRVVTATTDPAGLAYSVSYNGNATPPTAAGSYPVVAIISAPGYTASSANGTLVVAQAGQTIIFTSTAPSGAIYGGTYSVAANGGASGSPVTFSSLTTSICTVSGGTIKFVGTGACTVAANQAGNANYQTAAQVTQNIAIGKATLKVTAPNASRPYGAANPTFIPTAMGLVSPDTLASLGITCSSTANQTSPAGTYDITCASAAPLANYNATYVKGALTVTSAATTLTITSPANLERTDHGRVTVTAKLTGPGGAPLAGKAISFTAGSATASVTTNTAGVATATLTLAADQYTLTTRFAGGNGYQAASATQTIIAYQLTQFVIWGGNAGGVATGKTYTFWSSQWAKQVTGGDYRANSSFKGYASDLSADGKRWTTKPGDNCDLPEHLGKYIAVLVSTSITKNGSTISGNVTKLVILRVDDYRNFDPDDRHTGTGVLVATLP